jgi:hypothetical protein
MSERKKERSPTRHIGMRRDSSKPLARAATKNARRMFVRRAAPGHRRASIRLDARLHRRHCSDGYRNGASVLEA